MKPGLGVGYYSRGSSDLDLGYPIEFRSQLEVVKDLSAQNSLGLAVSHLSNADLDKDNPGVDLKIRVANVMLTTFGDQKKFPQLKLVFIF